MRTLWSVVNNTYEFVSCTCVFEGLFEIFFIVIHIHLSVRNQILYFTPINCTYFSINVQILQSLEVVKITAIKNTYKILDFDL